MLGDITIWQLVVLLYLGGALCLKELFAMDSNMVRVLTARSENMGFVILIYIIESFSNSLKFWGRVVI